MIDQMVVEVVEVAERGYKGKRVKKSRRETSHTQGCDLVDEPDVLPMLFIKFIFQ